MSNQEENIKSLSQTWPIPTKTSPIIIIGTGGIVKDAHLPAYKKAGFNVAGLYDVDKEKADSLAKEYGINKVFNSFEEAFENKDNAQALSFFNWIFPIDAVILFIIARLPGLFISNSHQLVFEVELSIPLFCFDGSPR